MEKVKIALSGVGGYGDWYLNTLERYIDPQTYTLTGVIDPYAEKAAHYEKLKAQNIPIYKSPEDFYADNSAELMIVSTPVQFHKEHSITAMANGSHVLCEKPLVPVIQDALELKQAQEKYNKLFGVGFQLSYSKPILDLKQDIVNCEFGKPLEFKSFSSWRRYDNYYQSSDWKGRVRGKNGEWILDAVSTNATAHYIFNIFFMAGDCIGMSGMPVETEANIYRAKEIESYDTCFIRGLFDNGCRFFYFSTHSGEREINPVFVYSFENAVVTMNEDSGQCQVTAKFKDGRIKNYGNALSGENCATKISTMIKAVRGESIVPCGIDTVMPHIVISNAIFDQADIIDFPKDICYRNENPPGTLVHNLVEDSLRCFDKMKLPTEMGYTWAGKSSALKTDGYNVFSGKKWKNEN